MIAAILPNIAADLVISVALAGSLISIFALAYALSSTDLDRADGEGGSPKAARGAMTIFSLANVVAASTHTFWGLAAARVLLACAAGHVHAKRERARRRPRSRRSDVVAPSRL